MEETCKIARENLRYASAKQKAHFDKKAKPRSFQVGSQVLLLLPWKKDKLEMAWRGPYRVEERVGPCDYRIMIGGKAKLFHANLLKRYVSRGDGQGSALVLEEQDEWEPVITTAERVPTVPLTQEEGPENVHQDSGTPELKTKIQTVIHIHRSILRIFHCAPV